MIDKKRLVLYFIPIIYFVLSAVFLAGHFAQVEKISRKVGNISVHAVTTKGSRISNKRVRKVELSFNGLEFNYKPGSPLILITEDEIVHRLHIESIEIDEYSLSIHFNNDVVLNYISDSHNNNVILEPDYPLILPPVDKIIFPISIANNHILEINDESYSIYSEEEELSYYLIMPAGTLLDTDESTLVLDASNKLSTSISLEESNSGSGKTVSDWQSREDGSVTLAAYDDGIKIFRDAFYSGSVDRLDVRSGNWELPDGTTYFSEQAALAFMAESLIRGSFTSNQVNWTSTFTRYPSKQTFLSMPYVGGNIIEQATAKLQADDRQIARIQGYLYSGSNDIFTESDLLNTFSSFNELAGRKGELYNIAMDLVEGEKRNLLAIRLQTLIDFYSYQDSEETLEAINQIYSSELEPNLFWINDDLLLYDSEGIADLKSTLKFGVILRNSAEILSNDSFLALGSKMILSVLRYSDEQGFVPESLLVSNNERPVPEGLMLPEEIYLDLGLSSFVPRMVSLENSLGAGAWILTSAEKVSVQSTPLETLIHLDYPANETHYLMVTAIRDHSRLYLHGSPIVSNLDFQRYTEGCLYIGPLEILYMKIKHRTDTETIRIDHSS